LHKIKIKCECLTAAVERDTLQTKRMSQQSMLKDGWDSVHNPDDEESQYDFYEKKWA
jgi:hypothetical protein